MKLFKKVIKEMTTCPDNETTSFWKVCFLIAFFGLIFVGAYLLIKEMLDFEKFVNGVAYFFGIGAGAVIGEEFNDRKGGMKDQPIASYTNPDERGMG